MIAESLFHRASTRTVAARVRANCEQKEKREGPTFGFLIVIMGRQQLFTEKTLTVISPLLCKRDWATFKNVCRLCWSRISITRKLSLAAKKFDVLRVLAAAR